MASEKEVRDQVGIYQLILLQDHSDARYVGCQILNLAIICLLRGGFIRLTDSAIFTKWTTRGITSGLGVSE